MRRKTGFGLKRGSALGHWASGTPCRRRSCLWDKSCFTTHHSLDGLRRSLWLVRRMLCRKLDAREFLPGAKAIAAAQSTAISSSNNCIETRSDQKGRKKRKHPRSSCLKNVARKYPPPPLYPERDWLKKKVNTECGRVWAHRCVWAHSCVWCVEHTTHRIRLCSEHEPRPSFSSKICDINCGTVKNKKWRNGST